jgi:hypothetical protein
LVTLYSVKTYKQFNDNRVISVALILKLTKSIFDPKPFWYVLLLGCMLLQFPMIPVVTWAQTNIGYEANAYSEATVARGTSSFKFDVNPAAFSSGVHWFGVQSYGMTELREMGISIGFGSNYLNSSVEIHHLGFDLLNESKLYTGFNFKFSTYSIGISFGGIQSSIKGYGQSRGIVSGIGITSEITSSLKFGGSVTNVYLWSGGDYILDSRYTSRFGLEISLSETLRIYSAVNIKPEYEPIISFAMESTLIEGLQIVAGYKTEIEEWSGGLRLEMNRIVVFLCTRRHPFLGWSLGAGFGITW